MSKKRQPKKKGISVEIDYEKLIKEMNNDGKTNYTQKTRKDQGSH